MWPFDDEEEVKQPAPPTPSQPMVTNSASDSQPMNPMVKDYLSQKYGLGEYSPEARKKIEDENAEDRNGVNWGAALAALGAGLQGHNGAAAGQAVLNSAEAARQGKLNEFDKKRMLAMQDINDKDMLAKRERENDINSPESKSAQELALKMGMRPETASLLTAAKFKDLAPTLSKAYQIDEGIKVRGDQLDFQREKLASEERLKNALLASKENQKASQLTPGQQALDKNFAKEYDEWTNVGEATVDKNIERLEQAKDKLSKSKDDLIGYSGLQGRLPNILRSEGSKTIQQDVQAAAQGALKATLGAQFTEKEGERIMNMAYDPTLSPEANIKKIDLAIQELKTQKLAKNAKAGYFEQNGTLAGLAKKDLPKPEGQGKKIAKKFRSKSTGLTKLVYDDGSSEIVNEAVANNGQ